MPANTPKHAIPYILGSDIGNTIDDTSKAQAERVDALLTPFDQGDLSARPVSTAASPGKAGRIFRATDGANAGRTFIDHGTGWTEVGALLGALLVLGQVQSAGAIFSMLGAATETIIGDVGPANQAGIRFGGNLNLYKESVAGALGLETGGRFRAINGVMSDTYIWSRDGTENAVIIGYNGAAAAPAILLGKTNPTLVTSGVENLRTIRGTVNADGTIAAGSGFTVTKGAAGVYTINFSTAFAAVPSVQATAGQAGAGASWRSPSTGSVIIDTWWVDATSGVGTPQATNYPFSFNAEGPR